MKNTILILSIAACVFSANAARADTLTAAVDAVTLAGAYSTITVIDDAGSQIIFNVTPATAISGDDDQPIALGDIRQNDTVRIEYGSLADGVGTAKSIQKINY